MCGIIAVFDPQRRESADIAGLTSAIQKGLDYIAHRGPDASCVWVNDDATCGKYTAYPI
jgi:asparagine synthetase B (glutamine-hydrolysing)